MGSPTPALRASVGLSSHPAQGGGLVSEGPAGYSCRRIFIRKAHDLALVQSDMDITLFKNNLLRGLHQKKLLDGESSVDHAQGYSRNFLGGKVHPKEIVDHPIYI